MSAQTPAKPWLAEAVARAKASALPLLARTLVPLDPASDVDAEEAVANFVEAVEVSLLALPGNEVSEAQIRGALRSLCELCAADLGLGWEQIADAIIGTLEWTPPDRRMHVLDSWGRR